MRPRIAISCGFYDEKERRIRPSVTYALSVWRAGGTPFYMPAAWDGDEWIHEVLAIADGILLTGGGDVVPSRYGSRVEAELQYPSALRDAVESRLVLAAATRGVPVLGICRGCQLVNIAFGGTLIQDLPTMRPSDTAHALNSGPRDEHLPVHEVALSPDSRVAAAYGVEAIAVNSMHHQAVERVGGGLAATARAPDGLVEAVEATNAWVVGVQWHPERMVDEHPEQLLLFEALVSAAARKAQTTA
jgi:putative glutamine amidotransferase